MHEDNVVIFGRACSGISKKQIFIAGAIVAVSGFLSLGGLCLQRVSAAAVNCDTNAIMNCGFSSASNFISKVKSNNSGNGHSDLKNIYAHYGLEPASYDRFVTSSRPGWAYSDGRIVVDNQTVATGARSIGRLASYQGSGYFSTTINGVKYYGNTNSRAFAKGVTKLPVTVLFNSKGVMQFAVLSACGNPEFGTNITPSYSCSTLHKTAVAGRSNTYQFTTSASAGNNATITKVVYNFGDGTSATESSPTAPVTHTYTKNGTYTAKVTVYVRLPGNQQVTVTSGGCQTTIKVEVPFYGCVQLSGAILDQSKMKFSFTATAKYGSGATLTGADFDFGDGNKLTGVLPDGGGNTFTVQHAYAAADTYNTTAVLHFMVDGQDVTAAGCAAIVSPTAPPTPECKPGVPVGSIACSPCPTDASLPADSPQCVTPPPSLPNTGAGDTIAVFGGVVVAGFLAYRQLIFRKHRAAFESALRGTSPLPLGDPLNQDKPLTGTPLARRRRTFRRKRQL